MTKPKKKPVKSSKQLVAKTKKTLKTTKVNKPVIAKTSAKFNFVSWLPLCGAVVSAVLLALMVLVGQDSLVSLTTSYAARDIFDAGLFVPAVRVVADLNLRWLLVGALGVQLFVYLLAVGLSRVRQNYDAIQKLTLLATCLFWLVAAEFLALSIGMHDVVTIKVFALLCVAIVIAARVAITRKPAKYIFAGIFGLWLVLLLRHVADSILYGDVRFALFQWLNIGVFVGVLIACTVLLRYKVTYLSNRFSKRLPGVIASRLQLFDAVVMVWVLTVVFLTR